MFAARLFAPRLFAPRLFVGRGGTGSLPGSTPTAGALSNLTGQRMFDWLPELWYARARSAMALLEAEGEALEQADLDTDTVRAARLPETAPDWGIARFEDELGLVPKPEMALEDRRSRAVARFRATGSTIARLKVIANAWGFGDIAIVPDPEGFTLYVQFVDTRGVPLGLEDHQAEMRANVQAHLDLQFSFRYLTWAELARSNHLWSDLISVPLTWDQLIAWKPT